MTSNSSSEVRDTTTGMGAPRGMEDDVDEARLQLRQALSHCSQDREELDRLRKMLQQEREAAQRREREIEELQVGVGAGVRVEV